jgi:hypothetical protein
VAENLVLNSMVLGQVYLAMVVIFIPAFVLLPSVPIYINNSLFHLVMLVFLTAAYHQFFQKKYVFFTVVKALLINVLFIVLFWVCVYSYVIAKQMIFD